MITTHCIISRNQGIVYKNPLLIEPAVEPTQENVDAAKRHGIVSFFTTLLFVSATAKSPRP